MYTLEELTEQGESIGIAAGDILEALLDTLLQCQAHRLSENHDQNESEQDHG